MSALRYAIADDHAIFRQGVRYALSDDPELICAGEAANGEELLELLQQQPVDVVLMDLRMPKMDGLQATTVIQKTHPDIKVVILTMHDDEAMMIHLMEQGVGGYLTKDTDPAEIGLALRSVLETGYYFNDRVSKALLGAAVSKQQVKPRFRTDVVLTDREQDVLVMTCNELTASEIGEKLAISGRRVEAIRSTLLAKIGVRNTAGLVLYAVRNGLVK
jgi:DNA-binding NarL/FixJ family response regulator